MRSILSELIQAEVEEKAKIIAENEEILDELKQKLTQEIEDISNIDQNINTILNAINKKINKIEEYKDKKWWELYEKKEKIKEKLKKYGDIDTLSEIIDDILFLKKLLKWSDEKRKMGFEHPDEIGLAGSDVGRYTKIAYGYYKYIQYTTRKRVQSLNEQLKKKYNITNAMIDDVKELIDIEKEIEELEHDADDEISEIEELRDLENLEEFKDKQIAIRNAIKLIDDIKQSADKKEKIEKIKSLIYLVNNHKLV